MRAYDTAIPLETFRAVMATGIVIAGLGLFLAMACAAGVLLSLYPGGPGRAAEREPPRCGT